MNSRNSFSRDSPKGARRKNSLKNSIKRDTSVKEICAPNPKRINGAAHLIATTATNSANSTRTYAPPTLNQSIEIRNVDENAARLLGSNKRFSSYFPASPPLHHLPGHVTLRSNVWKLTDSTFPSLIEVCFMDFLLSF